MSRRISGLLAAVLALWMAVPAFGAESGLQRVREYTPGQFTDVTADMWCAENVRTAYEYGIMDGTSETVFAVDSSLTAAQTVAMACRLHAGCTGRAVDFGASDPWYQVYLDYAGENGIVCAFADYGAAISRADFAVVLCSAMPEAALPVISTIEEGAVPDVSAGAAYYDAVYTLYRAGVLSGGDQRGTFAPDSQIDRATAAAIISRMADASLRKAITLEKAPWAPVAPDQLANLASMKKRMSDAELQAAYDVAVEIVRPLAELSREEQLQGIMAALRLRFDSGMSYSTETPHYNDPYGYFVLNTASCAGCARATGLCLNILGISYEHVNENQWSHQWCRVEMDDGSYWICDAYGLYAGEEPAPYEHPYFC